MDPQPLNIRVDSKQAQADLAALARALDTAGNSATTFKSKFTTGMQGADQAVKGATQAMGRFAEVTAMISRIKLSDDPAKQVKLLASAMNQLAKSEANIRTSTASLGKFAEVSALVDRIKINPANIKNLTDFSNAIAAVGKTRTPNPNSLKGLVDFLEIASRAQQLKFNPAMAANLRAFSAAMDSIGRARIITPARVASLKELFNVLANLKAPNGSQKLQSLFSTIAGIKVPSEKAIGRIKILFDTLAQAKAIPGAAKIAHDLDTIAAAANRAGAAIRTLPSNLKGLSPAFSGATRGANNLQTGLKNIPTHAQKAHGSILTLGKGLGDLDQRFKLSYQASTLFSQFFAAFTFGEFLHGIYDANIQLAKLQKSLVFSTGSFAGAERAADAYIGIANELGLSLGKTTEAYSKFTLSAKSSGLNLGQSNEIYKSMGTALQVVGASSQQTELAFYGLTQMIQKGKVSAEEFNRQIGEQIPGNAVLGARALSQLEGRQVSVAEFFKKMSNGAIMSAEFVPAYAEQIRRQFEPLVELARSRPDAALNRLTNSFFVFSREVGKGGLMHALTQEFDKLTDKIMYTDDAGTHLTPQFQKLADTMGRGLVDGVHLLGRGLDFLTDHLDDIVVALKLLLALRVGATFSDWGKSAAGLASNLSGVFGGKAAAQAVAKTGVAATIAQAAAPAQAIGALTGGQNTRSIIGRRSIGAIRTTTARQSLTSRIGNAFSAVVGGMGADITPMPHPTLNRASDYEAAFSSVTPMGARRMASGSRQNWLARYRASARIGANAFEEVGGATAAAGFVPLFGPGSKAAKASTSKSGGVMSALSGLLGMGGGAKTAAAGIKEAETVAAKAVGVFGKFGGVIGKVAPLLGLGLVGALAAGGLALAAFGDNTTKVQGKTMKFNDIVLGGFDVLAKGIGNWWDKSKGNFAGFTDTLKYLGDHAGDITATIVAGFVTMGKVIGRVLGTIGTIFSEFIQHSPMATFAKIMYSIATGDFKGAKKALGESASAGFGLTKIGQSVVGLVAGTAKDIGDFNSTKQQIIDAGAARAAARDSQVALDKETEAKRANIEATLAAAEAENAAAAKQQELADINRKIALGSLDTPSTAELLKRAQDAYAAKPAATTVAATGATLGGGTAAVSEDVMKGASQEVRTAINAAAAKYGVSSEYLFQTARRESNFNAKAQAGTSSAAGLFQFTKGTASQFGLTDRLDAGKSAEAAARLTAQNAKYLESKTGHAATNGELYAAHFLGAGGAAKLINASTKNPMATGAELFPDAAKANKNVFYKNGKALSVSELMANINSTFGSASGNVGAGMGGSAGITETEEESLSKKYNNAAETYNGLISRAASPATAAQSAFDKYKHDVAELLDLQDNLSKKGVNSFVDPARLKDAMDQAEKELKQAINPFLKLNEEVQHNNDVLAKRAAGLSDAADYQDQLNQYIEQGYKLTELDTQANRDAFKAGRDRAAQLQAQIDLTSTLNDLQQQRIQRNGSPLDAAIASRVKINEGETYDQAVARMQSSGSYGTAVKAAQAEVGQRQSFAKDDLRIEQVEMRATSRLSASARGYRDDFKNYLQQLSGISTGTLDEIEKKAGPSLVALAKNAADVKFAIENAPGFQRWADQIEPLAKKLNDLKGDFAEGISENLASALNGDQVDWSSFFRDFRKQIIKAQVQDVMKSAIGWLSGGKTPDALMTPEEKTKAAADATATAADQTSQAAVSLDSAATNLSTAGQALVSAAQAIATAGTSSGMVGLGAPAGGSGYGSGDLSGLTSLALGNNPDPIGAALNTGLPTNFPSISSASTAPDMLTIGQNDPTPVITIAGKRPELTSNVLGAMTPDRILDKADPIMPTLLSNSTNSGGGGLLSSIGNFVTKPQSGLAGLAKSVGITGLLTLLAGKKKKGNTDITHDINGVIGESRAVDVTGTQVAAKENAVGSILSAAIGMAGANGFGAPGGNLTGALGMGSHAAAGAMAMKAASSAGTNNLAGWLKRAFGGVSAGFFEEGGYASMPVSAAAFPSSTWDNAPHYKEGTPNTSGGMPAILHPDEAVIPLSRGRSIPVEMNGSGSSSNHYTTNMTIVTPDANSFRKSQGAIQRQQSVAQRRANVRNLT